MAEAKENVLMEKIVSLCKRRGFVFQSSEIYGGINGFWDYGPLGAELKRNVKELWWTSMTRRRDDVVGLEATIIMAPQIWRASGHVDTFADLMVECPITNRRFRADQVEPMSGKVFRFAGAVSEPQAHKIVESFLSHPIESIRAASNQLLSTADGWDHDATQGLVNVWISQNPDHFSKLADLDQQIRAAGGECKFTNVAFEVMVPSGKSDLSGRKIAKNFYSKRLGIAEPMYLIGEGEPIDPIGVPTEGATLYNPEKGDGFGARLTEPRPFNLMFKTYVGPVADEDNVAYLRPETAQAIFAQFKNVLETSRQKPPFGIAQVGKAFRNEVTPRNFIFRSREFEQMELEFFIKPDEAVEAICGNVAIPTPNSQLPTPEPNWGWQLWHQYWVEERVRFYEGIGLDRSTLGFHIQTPEELAHYARACTDILFKFPFSKRDEQGNVTGDELEGIAARSDFDLSQHERHSGKPMGVFDEELRTAWGKLDDAKKADLTQRYYAARLKYLTETPMPNDSPEKIAKEAKEDADGLAKGQYIPHVIEPSAGVDRLILALLANAYSEVTSTDDKSKVETRVVMKFHPRVAPIKVGVFPLLKNKPEIVAKAKEVFAMLRDQMMAYYDEGGAIGRRYARQDEAGTPYCVTIDFETMGEKPELLDTVTIRHRDDGRQERLPISELTAWLLARVR